MTASNISSPTIARMKHGDHYCGMYRTDEDHRAVARDFIRDGIALDEKMIYIVNINTAASLRAILEEGGIEVDRLLSRGQLVILTAKDSYLKDGEFNPHKMLALIRSEEEKALAEGFNGLRVTGEMTWALAGEPGSERLVEYESLLNQYFKSSPRTYAVCQYDERRFDAEVLMDILHTHPKVILGQKDVDNENMYYVPPEAFLSADRQRATLDRWLSNLDRRGQ